MVSDLLFGSLCLCLCFILTEEPVSTETPHQDDGSHNNSTSNLDAPSNPVFTAHAPAVILIAHCITTLPSVGVKVGVIFLSPNTNILK